MRDYVDIYNSFVIPSVEEGDGGAIPPERACPGLA